jgi:hypothetical protein
VRLADAVRLVRGVKIGHARRFAQHVVPEVVRPARVIWNQAIGGVFLLFAVSFLWYAITQSHNPAGMMMGIFLGFVMGFFCITSFLKARRISRL